ncbi:MAG: GlsB/YeaQ/YmgE family stress response membrane protein [Planctomycetes bacterium]|nr:GlsB/YeaQ/YmgE family stress response membrane protein [Planctomycetota bacterium]MCH9724140.1 GlsB/YeaQ/YmgE family stress response membrane protein [Planctomycetota bacterium]MCH9778037.1 GlsB/YeaQ/YmgE family stress response membrane protein [Planctomycetota bacterium]MCH9790734.1 GlsB/YeaQ/YmgE family stress response membrane protein [Planctomycetota bacterium]MDF1746228.1 GlsB/YeaQ/YmgE family stress response membrane protein [Gimesia sp.]
MGLPEFLIMLLVAGICGSIARALAGNTRGGCLVSIALGFIGALVGGKIAQMLGLPEIFSITFGGRSYPIVWSIIGASIFVAVLSLLSGRSRS